MHAFRQSILNLETKTGRRVVALRSAFNDVVRLAGGGMDLCLACDETDTYASEATKKAAWVSDHGLSHAGPAVVPERESPEGATLRLRFRVPEPLRDARRLVWWAAEPKPLSSAHEPASDPHTAYGAPAWPNSGCVLPDAEGFVTIQCLAPQSYLEGERRWPRHLHLMGADDGAVAPNPTLAVGVWPSRPGEEEDYECDHLEGSSHDGCAIVDYEQVLRAQSRPWTVDATGQNIDLFESGKQRFRSLRADDEALLEAVGKEVGDDPVVVFCANSKCNAARRLIRAWQRKNLCPNYFYMHEGYQPHQK